MLSVQSSLVPTLRLPASTISDQKSSKPDQNGMNNLEVKLIMFLSPEPVFTIPVIVIVSPRSQGKASCYCRRCFLSQNTAVNFVNVIQPEVSFSFANKRPYFSSYVTLL